MELESAGLRRRNLMMRKVLVKNQNATGDVLLDEALKHIKETEPPETLHTWVEYLSGTFRCSTRSAYLKFRILKQIKPNLSLLYRFTKTR